MEKSKRYAFLLFEMKKSAEGLFQQSARGTSNDGNVKVQNIARQISKSIDQDVTSDAQMRLRAVRMSCTELMSLAEDPAPIENRVPDQP